MTTLTTIKGQNEMTGVKFETVFINGEKIGKILKLEERWIKERYADGALSVNWLFEGDLCIKKQGITRKEIIKRIKGQF